MRRHEQIFSSSVSSLGNYLADTYHKARSAVETRSACRLAATGTNSYFAYRLPTIDFDDVLDGQSLFFILAWWSSTMRTVCQPITKSAVQLEFSCLDTFLYISVLCTCFNICMGAIPLTTHKLITLLRAVASSKAVIFFNFQKALVHV